MELPPIAFDREIAVFPLPNCVMFPGVVQPLHIFEPRYQEMMHQTLLGQRAIAMALLKPGWETVYHGCPAIHPTVCVGRVIAHERMADGKYNLLLQGMTRARVKSERTLTGEWGQYRVGLLEPVRDVEPDGGYETLQRKVLKAMIERTVLKDLTVTPALTALLEEAVPLDRLIDALAFSLVRDVEAKQRMLEESRSACRGEMLLRELVGLVRRLEPPAAPRWPPTPNVN